MAESDRALPAGQRRDLEGAQRLRRATARPPPTFSNKVIKKIDRHVRSMNWTVPDPEVDQRRLGERLRKKTDRHVTE